SLVNERFDPHEAKRRVGTIAGGGTVGGVLGGVIVWRAAEHLNVPMMLSILAGMNVIGFVGARRLARSGASPKSHEPITAGGGLTILRETPYLQQLALLVAVGATMQALLDWVVSAHATASYGTGQPLLAFFALFNMAVGVASFAAQAGLSRPLLERFGLSQTLKIQPLSVAVCGVLALITPGLSSIVLLRGVEAVTRNSLFRSAYELFYTPLPAYAKRPSKTLIDVGFDRIGTTLGGLLLLLFATLAPPAATLAVLVSTIALSVAAWLLATRLHNGYVGALAENLRTGAIALDEGHSLDFTTRQTLSETTAQIDRDELLARIEKFQKDKDARAIAAKLKGTTLDSTLLKSATAGANLLKSTTASSSFLGLIPRAAGSSRGLEGPPSAPGDMIVRNTERLRSNDPGLMKTALASLDPALAALAIPLLANDLVVRDAVRALRRVAPKVTGMLLDALLDFDVDAKVRRRIPRVLKVCRSQRAASGLLLALHDPVFEVRVEVALALAQVVRDAPELVVDRDAVFAIALEELSTGRRGWPRTSGERLSDVDPERHSDADSDARRDVEYAGPVSGPPRTSDDLARGLAHIFTLLSIVLEREPLAMAYRALRSDERALRGTAFEYLEVVLPPGLREAITPLLGDVQKTHTPKPRGRTELREELMRSASGLPKVKLPIIDKRD
ncbi:MAG: hypothetical protein JNK04_00180, partial [Myxococcales bacterium]|nr:hypothetical protein [Myxococcales bacterium]